MTGQMTQITPAEIELLMKMEKMNTPLFKHLMEHVMQILCVKTHDIEAFEKTEEFKEIMKKKKKR